MNMAILMLENLLKTERVEWIREEESVLMA